MKTRKRMRKKGKATENAGAIVHLPTAEQRARTGGREARSRRQHRFGFGAVLGKSVKAKRGQWTDEEIVGS